MRDAEGAKLREPLAIILGWSELLRSGRLQGEAVPRALEAIARNARMQANIIEELIDDEGVSLRPRRAS